MLNMAYLKTIQYLAHFDLAGTLIVDFLYI